MARYTSGMKSGSPLVIDRPAAIDWYLRNRARSRAIFDLIDPSAYYSRPIALRNPIVFYEGHLPAFSIISFIKRGLGGPSVDPRLEKLFERGIDPDTEDAAVPRSGAQTQWPSRDEVLAFADRVDETVVEALDAGGFADAGGHPATRRAEALYTALEHEAMHQETLLYMWHRLPYEQKRKPAGVRYELPPPEGGSHASGRTVRIPAGTATLGADRDAITFGWDNEFDEHRVDVAAFDIDVHKVTNADFLAFVEAGGYRDSALWSPENWAWVQKENLEQPAFWAPSTGAGTEGRSERFWRGMFEDIPLPPAWPVYVSQAEASAYARWKGRRLPTEAEFHRAAFIAPSEGAPGAEREYPWGSASPDEQHGHFDFQGWEPVPVGSRPAGASAWGVHDLVGNGWEWTSTIFAPFPGFSPMPSYPEYSADFFDGQHYVMKGGSSATARELLRRSFRNWFRPNYPYVYAGFRTVG
jgi:ergothioneine biosynthesis protein EgtB